MSTTSKKINLSSLTLRQKTRPHYTIIEGAGDKIKTRTLGPDEFLKEVQEDKTGKMAMQHHNLLNGPKGTMEGIASMFGG